ncbi:MAG: flagellar hook-associated protein FlgL [Moraxellaceae bacterium]|nr:flagellar hook-associated protein FlgL [Moraxellaceae bacterium]
MRISTSQIFNTNVSTMNRQEANLLQLQQQLALGKRVLQPSDDPVAAARSLEVSQAVSQVAQQQGNQGTANDSLSILESKLASIGELVTYVRERAIQAGNAALNPDDRKAIATDLRAQFENLLGIANTTDVNGEYLFAGFMGDTVPFVGNIGGGVSYFGDQGQRVLQVSSTRQMPVSQSGQEVFMNIPNLNGRFNTAPGATNSGGAIMSDGVVTGAYANGQYGIRFTAPGTYAVFDRAVDPGMTGAPMATGAYTSGTPIDLPPAPAASQIQVTIAGTPATGDTFTVEPGGNTDMFTILQQFTLALENTTGGDYQNAVVETLGRLDSALENVLKLRAQVGSRQVELDALSNSAEDLNLQYAERMNRLVGLNYTEAVTNLTLNNTFLEASRQSFSRVSQLNLFNFLD